jgi:hypothetical protein
MGNIGKIIQRVREITPQYYAASRAISENTNVIESVFGNALKDKKLPGLRDLWQGLDSQLSQYWPKLEAEVKKVGIFPAHQTISQLIAQAIMDVLLIEQATETTLDNSTRMPKKKDEKSYKTVLGRNIDNLREECGWSLNDLEKASGLDKKLMRGHISGKGAHPNTIKVYADTFSKQLGRKITAVDMNS